MASKASSGISFINTNLPQNRIRMIKSKEKIKELPGDCTVIFKCNINDRYIDHSVCGNFACLKNVLLVKFASCYYKKSISEKDYQPGNLGEDISDKDIDFPIRLW